MDLRIVGGAVLVGGELLDATLHVAAGDGLIAEIGSDLLFAVRREVARIE